ncbi:MAG: DUF1501 domain-containing protein, partial [Planctomycetaceae bacterium]|nr:DUF1501 domain-containing protein [Planctomycetaceae bacterium]
MFTILGKRRPFGRQFCDGVSRRDFLTIGGMAMGGIQLADTLRASDAVRSERSHKAIINIYLPGGPPHLDM